MWCGGISTHCEDDKHTKSDCGRHPHCNSSEPAGPVSPHAGIVAPACSKDQCRGALNSQLGARLIMDTLASLVENGYLGNRLTRQEREQAELERDPATGLTKRQRGEYVGVRRKPSPCMRAEAVEAGFDELTAQDFLGPRRARWHGYWQRA